MQIIGVMTGTSMDGIDACLVDLSQPRPVRVASQHAPMPEGLREALHRIQVGDWREDPLLQAAKASQALMLALVPVVDLLRHASPNPVRAIGVHGQTVRHWPEQGISLQLAAPALLAERLGIDVVSDFRSRDLAAGGQGAPLVPPFHAAIVHGRHQGAVAVLNLGGIANLSLIEDEKVRGFDTGPANTLMDLWSAEHLGLPFDAEGQWAASAEPNQALLARMLEDPYFSRPWPKSTGRDYFSLGWLQRHLESFGQRIHPATVQASLLALTAQTILAQIPHQTQAVYLCGGGARNTALVSALRAGLPEHCTLQDTEVLGWPAEDIEAGAFAWLAGQHLRGLAGNEPGVTGAHGPRVLGSLTPGSLSPGSPSPRR
jgi:anhydro-N-acetylmuramic acid kinase